MTATFIYPPVIFSLLPGPSPAHQPSHIYTAWLDTVLARPAGNSAHRPLPQSAGRSGKKISARQQNTILSVLQPLPGRRIPAQRSAGHSAGQGFLLTQNTCHFYHPPVLSPPAFRQPTLSDPSGRAPQRSPAILKITITGASHCYAWPCLPVFCPAVLSKGQGSLFAQDPCHFFETPYELQHDVWPRFAISGCVRFRPPRPRRPACSLAERCIGQSLSGGSAIF